VEQLWKASGDGNAEFMSNVGAESVIFSMAPMTGSAFAPLFFSAVDPPANPDGSGPPQ
jgi:hypothetical protein